MRTVVRGLWSPSSRFIQPSFIAFTRPPNRTLSGDGLITSEPGILLGIKTADCLPVLIADPERRAIGAFHAGWRGTARRIVEKGVGEMRKNFGSDPAEVAGRHRSRHRRLLL